MEEGGEEVEEERGEEVEEERGGGGVVEGRIYSLDGTLVEKWDCRCLRREGDGGGRGRGRGRRSC